MIYKFINDDKLFICSFKVRVIQKNHLSYSRWRI